MKVSILVPWRKDPSSPSRDAAWRWLKRRWKLMVPEAELVVGTDKGMPFSKSAAINDAYSKATGDVFVLADADSWMEIPELVAGIGYAVRNNCLVVPWVKAHRLSQQDSALIQAMDPTTIYPVTQEMRERAEDYRPSPSTAAMVCVVTREGFERVGGMDPRFRGWGGEDVAFGLACGTLLGETKLMMGEAFALFHERGRLPNQSRIWHDDDGGHNAKLGDRYWSAAGYPDRMTPLCSEHQLEGARFEVGATTRANERPTHLLVHEFRENLIGGTQDGDRIVL